MQVSRDLQAQPSAHIPPHGEMNFSSHELLAVSVMKFAAEVAWIWLIRATL
jgi:hypothetical protein